MSATQSAPAATETQKKTFTHITRFAAKSGITSLRLPHRQAHDIRGKIDRMTATPSRSGDQRHAHSDHHLVHVQEVVKLLNCPKLREQFESIDWSFHFSKTCREVVNLHQVA